MINNNSSPHNSMEGDLPLLVSIPQAAKTLGISTRKLFNLTRDGTIPHVRLGRRVMYIQNSLHDAVAKNTFVGGDKNGKYI